MIRLDGRIAIVTGAGRGLGRSYALDLARRGASVVVNDAGVAVDGRGGDQKPAEQVAEEIESQGGRAIADFSSVDEADSGPDLVRRAIEEFGGLDIIVNNAGIMRNAPIDQLRLEDVRVTIDVHLMGTIHLVRSAWNHLAEQGYGRVVLTTSTSGFFGNPRQSAYAAAKMGLVGLTKVWALEGEAHGIKVNAISPGARSRMTPGLPKAQGRLKPENVAPIVSYLASETCQVSGDIWFAAGGLVRRLFVGATDGVDFSAEEEGRLAEEVAKRVEEIRSTDSFEIPGSMVEDLRRTLERLNSS